MLRKALINVLIFIIRLYQTCISPFLFATSCRFYPSCSQYAIEAIAMHGPVKGVYLGAKRILRCNPLHPGGYDPVK
ncbi:MAG: membrane protein insertion efficiency factor YidD [Smithellaceae bacterium]